MGIESDQLVFDYLSRVGDLAHGTAMTASERAELVSGLRSEIDRKRAAEGGAHTKSAVKKILKQLGKPDEVVAAHSNGHRPARPAPRPSYEPEERDGKDEPDGSQPGVPETPGVPEVPLGGAGAPGGADTDPLVPGPRAGAGDDPGSGGGADGTGADGPSLRKTGPGPAPAPAPVARVPAPSPEPVPEAEHGPEREAERGPGPPPGGFGGAAGGGWGSAAGGAAPPHLAGMDELGPEESDPDWWRLEPSPYTEGGGSGGSFGDAVPGFIGGIERPELFKPPKKDVAEDDGGDDGDETAKDDGGDGAEPPPTGLRGLVPRPRPSGRAPGAAPVGPRAGGVVELLAAALLLAGAVVGSLVPLGLGWLAAWWSPRLTRTEAKWAAAGVPGLVAAATTGWLWGRLDGRWGDPIGAGGEALRQALTDVMPVLLRIAAVASALYLIWRARRPAPGA